MEKQGHILVVEDDSAIARGLREFLEAEGYAVHTIPDGMTAVRKATSLSVDLVLLDLNLPRLNGIQVCRRMREAGLRVPIVILTARAEGVDKVVGLEAGADDYVTKPFDSHELLARIRAHLRRREQGVRRTSVSGRANRQLLSVMFTDMCGFSKRMYTDERTAIAVLRTHNSIISRAVERHDGTVIEIIGDAFMVSFASALQAVQCASEILRSFMKRNAGASGTRQVHVRIGIHIGDVVHDAGKLRGNAVNIAARLQQLASPDHISISESVYEAIKGRIREKITRVGKKRLKNIRGPVGVYRIGVDGKGVKPRNSLTDPAQR